MEFKCVECNIRPQTATDNLCQRCIDWFEKREPMYELKESRYIDKCHWSGGDQVMFDKAERKEVLMKHCSLCQREMPSAGPDSGIGYKSEVLCGTCLLAAQRVCPHSLRKDDGITCRDCGARPWTAGRVVKGVIGGVVKVAGSVAKMFLAYTIASIMGAIVTLGLAYLAAKKMGFLP